MKRFAVLYNTSCEANKDNVKEDALIEYLGNTEPADVCCALNLLRGKKLKKLTTPGTLKAMMLEFTGISEWLFDECCEHVGDTIETISLLLPETKTDAALKLHDIINELWQSSRYNNTLTRELLLNYWKKLTPSEIYLFNKMVTGSYRPCVKESNIIKAIAKYSGVDETVIAHRFKQMPVINEEDYKKIISSDAGDADISRPYRFCLANDIINESIETEDINDWQVEWKIAGARAQLIKRKGEVFVWSVNGELVTESFPELISMANLLPDGTVIDGHIIPYKNNKPLLSENIQKRLGKKNISKKLVDEIPVVFKAYDIMEYNNESICSQKLFERRKLLEAIYTDCNNTSLMLSEVINAAEWADVYKARNEARNNYTDGIILKRKYSVYNTASNYNVWFKWNAEPLKIKAVLIYAQRGSGQWTALYSEYTFAVWKNNELIPVAKANKGLPEEEVKYIDDFVKKNTLEKFGPVRTVKPALVFEIEFDNVQNSARHKSGVVVKNPRILHRLNEANISNADCLETILQFIDM